jgi:4-diphosphocytidyl-2-C-methyl-D-erythritol kinase
MTIPGAYPGTPSGPTRYPDGLLSIEAHAKINLNLKVLGRRPDGYHELVSVLQSVSLSDTLTLTTRREGIALQVEGADVPSDRSNLVWKAAELLLARCSVRVGAQIHLRKRVPAGAGLGGGSSDAAAALVGLNRLWGLDLGPETLRSLAPELGADVAYFLVGGTALITGRGEEVRPLPDLPTCELLIVFPGEPIPTASIYAQVDAPLTPVGKADSMTRLRLSSSGGLEEWVGAGNDLEPIALRSCPAIRTIKARLRSAGAFAAAMTGSGSAVFGAFQDCGLRDRAARELKRAGWDVVGCVPLSRQAYRKTLGLN